MTHQDTVIRCTYFNNEATRKYVLLTSSVERNRLWKEFNNGDWKIITREEEIEKEDSEIRVVRIACELPIA